jgi:hypothetical protein
MDPWGNYFWNGPKARREEYEGRGELLGPKGSSADLRHVSVELASLACVVESSVLRPLASSHRPVWALKAGRAPFFFLPPSISSTVEAQGGDETLGGGCKV